MLAPNCSSTECHALSSAMSLMSPPSGTSAHLQHLVDGFAVHGLFVVGGLVEGAGEGAEGQELLHADLREATWWPSPKQGHAKVGVHGAGVPLTTENLPSPNHITQRVPSAARLRPVIHQDTMRPGHQEKPRSLPHTSSPIPKPRPSWDREGHKEGTASGLSSSRPWSRTVLLAWDVLTSYSGSSSADLDVFLSTASATTGSGVVATLGEAGSVGCCEAGGLASSSFCGSARGVSSTTFITAITFAFFSAWWKRGVRAVQEASSHPTASVSHFNLIPSYPIPLQLHSAPLRSIP